MTLHVLTPPLEAVAVNRTALRRLGTPDDIAKVVAFLASDDAAWITCEVITGRCQVRKAPTSDIDHGWRLSQQGS
jgi:NAD(P)-dependent dehydrogenase (short-subunit alcohol dehydrogenase family)